MSTNEPREPLAIVLVAGGGFGDLRGVEEAGVITWISTKSPIRMLDTPIGRGVETHLRQNHGIDAALLAVELGLSAAHVEAFQRQLGLRKFAPRGVRCGRP